MSLTAKVTPPAIPAHPFLLSPSGISFHQSRATLVLKQVFSSLYLQRWAGSAHRRILVGDY